MALAKEERRNTDENIGKQEDLAMRPKLNMCDKAGILWGEGENARRISYGAAFASKTQFF